MVDAIPPIQRRSNVFQRMSNICPDNGMSGDITFIPSAGHTDSFGGGSNPRYRNNNSTGKMAYFTDKANFQTIFLFFITVLLSIIVLFFLGLVVWISNNKAIIVQTTEDISKRMEPFEQTLRTVNSMMRTLRVVYGDELFDGTNIIIDQGGTGGGDDGSIIKHQQLPRSYLHAHTKQTQL